MMIELVLVIITFKDNKLNKYFFQEQIEAFVGFLAIES